MAAVLLLCASIASYAGFACMALAMPEHWEKAGGRAGAQAARGRVLRLCGALMLCVALALCLWRDGPGFGSLLWAVLLSAGGIAVALTLTWRPRWLLIWHAGFRPSARR